MTCTIHFFLFSLLLYYHSILCLSISHPPSPNSRTPPYILPIKKDQATNRYYTSIGIGSPRHNFDVAIDLAGENLWYDCDNHYNSSSYNPITCDSNRCPRNNHPCGNCYGSYKPGCTNNTCGTDNYNPLSQIIFPGNLAEDIIFISQVQVFGLISSCTNSDAFSSLPKTKSTKGIIGLARSQLALPTQLALLKNLSYPKFSLCLPSSNNQGFINLLIIGPDQGHPYPKNVSKYVKIQTTHLVVNPHDKGPVFEEGVPSTEYFIDVKSIKIDGNVVDLNPSLLSIDRKGNGGTKISTMTRFAELQSFVYKPFVRDFLKKAADRRLKRVATVPPFEACFDSTTTGFSVPTIDLVLQGGVQWTIHGANSMVMVKKNVACLAFVDGGTMATMSFYKASIVIGAHQLEDNLLVFDLASSKLGFTSSLFLHNASCSHFF